MHKILSIVLSSCKSIGSFPDSEMANYRILLKCSVFRKITNKHTIADINFIDIVQLIKSFSQTHQSNCTSRKKKSYFLKNNS